MILLACGYEVQLRCFKVSSLTSFTDALTGFRIENIDLLRKLELHTEELGAIQSFDLGANAALSRALVTHLED